MSERSERPLSVTAGWDWGCWMVGVFIDTGVLYTGWDGLRRAVDLDFALGCLMVQVRWSWLHQPYREGEGILDALARHEERLWRHHHPR